MFILIKGEKLYYPMNEYLDQLENKGYSNYKSKQIALKYGKKSNGMLQLASVMFNRFKEIAGSGKPVTSFLQTRLSLISYK